jgi:hypothetical protein
VHARSASVQACAHANPRLIPSFHFQAGVDVLLLEASDGVGGRVRTDNVEARARSALRACGTRHTHAMQRTRVAAHQALMRTAHTLRSPHTPHARTQGFLLDRGFQIFLTSYPEARAALDYEALSLRPFYAGALVRWNAGWHRVADPVRHPADALATLLPDNPVGDVVDKLRVGLLRCVRACARFPVRACFRVSGVALCADEARACVMPLRSVLSLLTAPYDFITAPEQSTRARLQQARPFCAQHTHMHTRTHARTHASIDTSCAVFLAAASRMAAGFFGCHGDPFLAPVPGGYLFR